MFIARGAITKDRHGVTATSAGLTLQTSLDNQVRLGRTAAQGQTPLTATSRQGMKEAEEREMKRRHLLTTSKPRAVVRKQYADNKNGTKDSRR